jgi:hypothetical protein
MWIISKVGFFSCVVKPDNPNSMTVRARVKEALDALRAKYMPTLGKTFKVGESDYEFRALITKKNFALGMLEMSLDVDYDNFKSTVAKDQGLDRYHIYSDVWDSLLQLQAPTRTDALYQSSHTWQKLKENSID